MALGQCSHGESETIFKNTDIGYQESFSVTVDAIVPNYNPKEFTSAGEFLRYAFIGKDGSAWRVRFDTNLAKSNDLGNEWFVKDLSSENSLKSSEFTDIEFVDALNGWIAGDNSVLITHDSGQTWREVFLDKSGYLSRNYQNGKLAFYDKSVGYFGARNNVINQESVDIWKTIDGGDSWELVYRRKTPGAYTSAGALLSVSKQETIANVGGDLLRTVDGGKSWKKIASGLGGREIVENDGLLWSFNYNSETWYSDDRGENWHSIKLSDGTVARFNSMGFSSSRSVLGVAVGEQGAIFVSFDNGKEWKPIDAPIKIEHEANRPRVSMKNDRIKSDQNGAPVVGFPKEDVKKDLLSVSVGNDMALIFDTNWNLYRLTIER